MPAKTGADAEVPPTINVSLVMPWRNFRYAEKIAVVISRSRDRHVGHIAHAVAAGLPGWLAEDRCSCRHRSRRHHGRSVIPSFLGNIGKCGTKIGAVATPVCPVAFIKFTATEPGSFWHTCWKIHLEATDGRRFIGYVTGCGPLSPADDKNVMPLLFAC